LPSPAVDREVSQHGAVDDGIAFVAIPVAGISGKVVSAHEHWQMDASAPELYERYLVPAITSVWANDLPDRVGPTPERARHRLRDTPTVLRAATALGPADVR
jgi:hypothetical protein